MATGYIYNGFGGYDSLDGKQGVLLRYAGVNFFLPFQEVTIIPDWTLRQVDQDKSTPDGEGEGVLTYITSVVPGKRVVEELTQTQIPVKNELRGIIEITGKPTGQIISIECGVSQEGKVVTSEVREVVATQAEKDRAAKLALEYRKASIQEYFQSKRERMAGGHGQLFPTGLIRVFMDELNIEDIDDVSKHQKPVGGMDPELLKVILEAVQKSGEVKAAEIVKAVESARKQGRGIGPAKPRSRNLAEYKQSYDAAIAAGKTPEEATELAETTQA